MSLADVETRIVESRGSVFDYGDSSSSDNLVSNAERLGRYVLLVRLGRGAFGTVWAAYDPELDRKVAIKIVQARRRRTELAPGDTSPSLENSARDAELHATEVSRATLLREAQLLAQLSHPNVVAIHDVGRIEDALRLTSEQSGFELTGVFIVMEHLDGPTLAEWASEARRSPVDVLDVFAQAGRGLLAAHERGFVHLDFKPGNVMFGADGRVRVLDFGLARVGRRISRRGDDGHARVAGTPAYMAPEQHEGRAADGRADQYAFCTALWEALYGARPFEAAEGEGEAELLAAKRRGPPPVPRRSGLPPQLDALLRRGLASEPAERFPDMQQLLDALADDPRLRWRRRTIAASTLVSLLGLGFGLARGSISTGSAEDPCALPEDAFAEVWDEQRKAEVARGFRATEAEFAEPTLAAIVPMLDQHLRGWSDTRTEICRASLVEAEQSVEQMSEQLLCLDRQLQRVAGLTATFTEADAEVVARARDSIAQLDSPQACLARASEPSDGSAPEDQRRDSVLALERTLARAHAAIDLGRWDRGLALAEQAVERARELDDSSSLARAELQRALALRLMSRYDDALAALRAAQVAAVTAGDGPLEVEIEVELVGLYTDRGDHAVAEELAILLEPHVRAEPRARLAIRLALYRGNLHQLQQRWDAARSQFEHGAALLQRTPELADAKALEAKIEFSLANIELASGRDFQAAVDRYRHALALWTEAYGPNHPDVARAMINLGMVYFRRGELDQARDLLLGALAILDPLLDRNHKLRGMLHQNLGALHMLLGRFDLAIEHTREAARILEASVGSDHPDLAGVQRNLASLLSLRGRQDEALPLLERALAGYDADDARRISVHVELIDVLWWMGRDDELAPHIEAVARLRELLGPTDLRRVEAFSSAAVTRERAGELVQALPWVDQALEALLAISGDAHSDTARMRVQKARVLRGLGRVSEAREQLALASAQLEPPGSEPHPFAWELHLELARLARIDQPDRVGVELERALALASGEQGSPVHGMLVELELAEHLATRDPARSRELASHALELLRARSLRPEWTERAKTLLR